MLLYHLKKKQYIVFLYIYIFFDHIEKPRFLDVTQLENLLTKESAKAECEHLKKLGTDWSNKYYRTDLIIWTEEDNVKGCLDSSFTGDLSLCKVYC